MFKHAQYSVQQTNNSSIRTTQSYITAVHRLDNSTTTDTTDQSSTISKLVARTRDNHMPQKQPIERQTDDYVIRPRSPWTDHTNIFETVDSRPQLTAAGWLTVHRLTRSIDCRLNNRQSRPITVHVNDAHTIDGQLRQNENGMNGHKQNNCSY